MGSAFGAMILKRRIRTSWRVGILRPTGVFVFFRNCGAWLIFCLLSQTINSSANLYGYDGWGCVCNQLWKYTEFQMLLEIIELSAPDTSAKWLRGGPHVAFFAYAAISLFDSLSYYVEQFYWQMLCTCFTWLNARMIALKAINLLLLLFCCVFTF